MPATVVRFCSVVSRVISLGSVVAGLGCSSDSTQQRPAQPTSANVSPTVDAELPATDDTVAATPAPAPAAAATAGQAPCASGHRRLDASDVGPGERLPRADAANWQAPPTLRFEVDPTARLGQFQRLTVQGTLFNDSTAPIRVIVFPVAGPFLPSSAFRVVFSPDPRIRHVRTGPPRPPPAPPPPLRFELPACSALVLSGGVTLSEVAYPKGLKAELEWSLLYWSGTRPTGTVKATLP